MKFKIAFAVVIFLIFPSISQAANTDEKIPVASTKEEYRIPSSELNSACEKVAEKDRAECEKFIKAINETQNKQDLKLPPSNTEARP